MPIYEYECPKCGEKFDVMQKATDAPLKKCQKCNKVGVKKLIGAPALQFKGSGWYVTDYAGKNPASDASGESKSKTDSKPDAKSDTKPVTTSEPKPASACACSTGGCAH